MRLTCSALTGKSVSLSPKILLAATQLCKDVLQRTTETRPGIFFGSINEFVSVRNGRGRLPRRTMDVQAVTDA